MAETKGKFGKNPFLIILYTIVEICQSKRGFIMKKKVIILAMAAAMCSAALLAGCGEETTTSTPSAPASSSASSAAPAESSSTVESKTEPSAETGKGDIGKYNVEVLGVKVVKNSDNEDVAIINVNFTNVSNDEAANYGTSIVTEVYQDGVQLQTTAANRDQYDFDSYYTNVKKGASVKVDYCIKLSNTTSPIEVELSEAFTVNSNQKVTKTLELPQA